MAVVFEGSLPTFPVAFEQGPKNPHQILIGPRTPGRSWDGRGSCRIWCNFSVAIEDFLSSCWSVFLWLVSSKCKRDRPPNQSRNVVALWEALYIENKRFDLDTLRVPNRSPTSISKSTDLLGQSDDIWGARGPHFLPIWRVPGARAGLANTFCLAL